MANWNLKMRWFKKHRSTEDTANASVDMPKPVLRRLLLPLAALLVVLLVGAGSLMYQQLQQQLAKGITDDIADISGNLRTALDQQTFGLAVTAQSIADNATTQKALRQDDANGLMAAWQPAFETLHREHHLTHFYFFDKNRICLLRIHNPEKHGDRIDRFTALEAQRTGKTASGIELGPLGTFTLRVVQPVFESGKLAGYVELGKEIEDVLRTPKNRSDIQLAVVIHKKHLNRQSWQDGMRLLGREGDWDRLQNNVVIYASQGRLPDAFAPWANRTAGQHTKREMNKEIAFDGKDWRISATLLQDASGKEVGDLLVMRDVSTEKAAYARLLAMGGIGGGVLLTLLLGLVFVLLRHTDEGIRAQQAALRESELSYRNQFANNSSVMLLIDPVNGAITDANAAALSFYGYPRKRLLAMHITDINTIAASEVRQVMASITQEQGKLFQCQHRIADGSLRNVEVSLSSIQFGGRTILHSIIHDITKRKRMEEQMRINEALLSNAIALAQLAPWEYDVASNMFVLNAYFYAMCATSVEREGGYVKTPEDFARDLIPAEDAGIISSELALAIADRNHDYSRQVEYRIIRRDGQIRHVIGRFKAIKDPAGGTVKLYGTTQDITQRKLAEAAIHESQQLLSNIMQFYPEATMVIDSAGRVITWNRAMEKLTGVDASQMLGKGDHEYALPFYGVRRPLLLDYFAKPDEASIHGYTSVKWQDDVLAAEVKVGHLRGGTAHLYVTATALRNLSGEITGAIESVHNITARKIMEESLHASERMLSGAIELANLAYWTYKVKEGVFLFNNQFYTSCGTTAEQEGGFCISTEAYLSGLVHPEDADRVAGEIATALASDDPNYSRRFDHRVVGRDGKVRTMAVSFSITRDDSGHPEVFYGTSQDITSRKQTEETLRSRTALLEAQMNATLDGILVIDEKQKRVFTNPRIVELFDVPRHIMDDEDDASLLKHVVGLTRYPEKFLEKVMYLYDNQSETSRDEIEFKNGMVLDRYSSPVLGKDGKNYGRIWTFRDITARKQAQEELLHSEMKFRTLYDSTSDAVMMLDEKGFFDCNKATLMVFGCQTKEEFCSKHPADVSPLVQPCGTDSLTLANQHIAMAMKKGSHRFEWMHKRANTGEDFPAEVLLTAMELDGRQVLQATVRDITYRKQAEEAILRSREQLRLLLNSTGEGIYGVDMNGICTFHNPACLRMLGYNQTDKLLGENMHTLMHHTDAHGKYIDVADCPIIKAINMGEGTHADDEVFWRSDGTSFPVEYWAYPQIHDGVFVGVVVTFVDISQRKLMEKRSRSDFERIQCQSADLQAIFDAAPVGFLLVNEKAQITRVNDVVAKMVGKDMTAMLDVQPGDGLCCIHALAAPAGCGTGKDCSECLIRMNLTHVLQTGETVRGLEVHYSMHINGQDLLLWLSISMSPLIINDSPHVLMAITNITDQKQAEKRLKAAAAANPGRN